MGKSKSEFPKVPTYRSVTKFTLGTNIPYCTFFKFYIIVWRRLYHFYHECREEDEPWMTHPFCLDDDFFFKTKFFFFLLLLFGYFLAKSPFFWPSLHFEKWDLSLDPISCHTKKALPCLEIFNRTTLNWSIDFFEQYEKCTCPDTVGYNSKKSAIYFWVVPLKTIWLAKYLFYLQISKSNQSTLNSM